MSRHIPRRFNFRYPNRLHLAPIQISFDPKPDASFLLAAADNVHNARCSVFVEQCQPVAFHQQPVTAFDAVRLQGTFSRMSHRLFEKLVSWITAKTRNVDNVSFQGLALVRHC
jgi:hypothetical protein